MIFPDSSSNLYAPFFKLCRILKDPSSLATNFPSHMGFQAFPHAFYTRSHSWNYIGASLELKRWVIRHLQALVMMTTFFSHLLNRSRSTCSVSLFWGSAKQFLRSETSPTLTSSIASILYVSRKGVSSIVD